MLGRTHRENDGHPDTRIVCCAYKYVRRTSTPHHHHHQRELYSSIYYNSLCVVCVVLQSKQRRQQQQQPNESDNRRHTHPKHTYKSYKIYKTYTEAKRTLSIIYTHTAAQHPAHITATTNIFIIFQLNDMLSTMLLFVTATAHNDVVVSEQHSTTVGVALRWNER